MRKIVKLEMKKQATLLLVLLTLASLFAACRADVNRSFWHGTSPDLVGTGWTLTSLDGSRLIADTEITLSIQEAYLGGTMTCNNYGGGPDSGAYTVSDGRLAIRQLAVTVQLCSEPEGVMEQEAAYIEALYAAATYRVADDRLEIADAGGSTRLVFQLEQ
jgi:heat shock protein HslJ